MPGPTLGEQQRPTWGDGPCSSPENSFHRECFCLHSELAGAGPPPSERSRSQDQGQQQLFPNAWHLVPLCLAHVQPGSTQPGSCPTCPAHAPLLCLPSGLPTPLTTDTGPGVIETPTRTLPGPGTGSGRTPGDLVTAQTTLDHLAAQLMPPPGTALVPPGLRTLPPAHEHSVPFTGPISSMTSGPRYSP